MSGWELQAEWPVEKGDEITSAHFEDLRKMIWSIDWILEPDKDVWDFEETPYSEGDIRWWIGEEWLCTDNDPSWREPGDPDGSWIEYPQPWDSETIYHQYDKVLFNLFDHLDIKRYSRWEEYAMGDFVKKGGGFYVSLKNANKGNSLSAAAWWNEIVDTQFHYMLGCSHSEGVPPVRNSPWHRIVRRDKYCDYNTNSGCYNFYGQGPAYLQLPPQVNKYTQVAMTHRQTGYVVPAELMFAKNYESPVELSINRENFNGMQALITGPIGARYVEYHSYPGAGPMFPPFYYPYYVSDGGVGAGGVSYKDDSYYDRKLQGYQSFIEGFVDGKGNKFKWPLEGQDLQDALEGEQNPYWTMRDKSWLCNASAFEKALELTGEYDWYLDLKFPPDPDMYKLQNLALWRKGAWRKTWKYSFGTPLGLMWPQEKGDPPYLGEGNSWWANWDNCQKVYQEALNKLNVNDIKHIAERHWPMRIPRADELAKKQQEKPTEETPDDFQEAIDHLMAMYEEMLRVIKGAGVPHWAPNKSYSPGGYVQHWAVYYKCIKGHISSLDDLKTQASWNALWKKVEQWELYKDIEQWAPKVDMCFEIAAGLVNQMKQVLERLKWVSVSDPSPSSAAQFRYGHDDIGGFPIPSHEGWSWSRYVNYVASEVAKNIGALQDFGSADTVEFEDAHVLGCDFSWMWTYAEPNALGGGEPYVENGVDASKIIYTFSGSETERLLKHTGVYGKNARIILSVNGYLDVEWIYDTYMNGWPDPGGDVISYDTLIIGNLLAVSSEYKYGEPTKGWTEVTYLAKGEEFEVEVGYSSGRWSAWGPPPDPIGGSNPDPPGESWLVGVVHVHLGCDAMLVEIDPLKVDLGCVPVE